MNLTLSEMKIVKAILDNNSNSVTSDIKKQYENLTIKNRDYTGSGLYIYFSSDNEHINIDNNIDAILGGIHAVVDGLQYGASFILYIKNGLISTLECVSYNETWPKNEFVVKKIFKVRKDGSLQNLM